MRYAPGRWEPDRWARFSGRRFSVAGRGDPTDAAADNCICNLWNPDTTRSLWVAEFGYTQATNPTTLDRKRLLRTSTRGTAGITQTPDLVNDLEREVTPDTGAVLDLSNFTVEPTIVASELYAIGFPITGNTQNLTWLFPDGFKVPPGTGLGLFTTGAVATTLTTVYYSFWE